MSAKTRWWRKADGTLVTHRGRLALAVRNTRRRMRSAYLRNLEKIAESAANAVNEARAHDVKEFDALCRRQSEAFDRLVGAALSLRIWRQLSPEGIHTFHAAMKVSDELLESIANGADELLAREIGARIEREVLAEIKRKHQEREARRAALRKAENPIVEWFRGLRNGF